MPDIKLGLTALILFVSCLLYLSWGLAGNIAFIIELRSIKLVSLVLVGACVGISTVLFQTISANRILTPSIMGFDALFILMQTALVFFLGGFVYSALPKTGQFLIEVAIMMIASLLLFKIILRRTAGDIHLLILVGIIFGLMFRSLSAFMQRLIDPSEFAIIQQSLFATFSTVQTDELALACAMFVVSTVAIWPIRNALDVIALGRPSAITLGVDYEAVQKFVLLIIAVQVSIATALVGPIVFLGLLVAALAHNVLKSYRHALLLPMAAMIGASVLVLGQFAFERVFKLESTLSIIIEFVGGILFMFLVFKGRLT